MSHQVPGSCTCRSVLVRETECIWVFDANYTKRQLNTVTPRLHWLEEVALVIGWLILVSMDYKPTVVIFVNGQLSM